MFCSLSKRKKEPKFKMNTQFNSNVIWLQLEYKISTLIQRRFWYVLLKTMKIKTWLQKDFDPFSVYWVDLCFGVSWAYFRWIQTVFPVLHGFLSQFLAFKMQKNWWNFPNKLLNPTLASLLILLKTMKIQSWLQNGFDPLSVYWVDLCFGVSWAYFR